MNVPDGNDRRPGAAEAFVAARDLLTALSAELGSQILAADDPGAKPGLLRSHAAVLHERRMLRLDDADAVAAVLRRMPARFAELRGGASR